VQAFLKNAVKLLYCMEIKPQSMRINEGLLKDRIQELKEAGLKEGYLDEEHFGLIKIYISKEPAQIMLVLALGEEKIYVGSD
jgi:hypothetical protein